MHAIVRQLVNPRPLKSRAFFFPTEMLSALAPKQEWSLHGAQTFPLPSDGSSETEREQRPGLCAHEASSNGASAMKMFKCQICTKPPPASSSTNSYANSISEDRSLSSTASKTGFNTMYKSVKHTQTAGPNNHYA